MDISFTQAVVAGILILLTFVYIWIKNRGMLPGPKGVPYLGLYPYLTDENMLSKFKEYTKKYGDVFSFTYAGRLYINLGSIKAAREVMVNKSDCFTEKLHETGILFSILGNSVIIANGEPWKILRKFFIRAFKEHGLSSVQDSMAGPLYDSLNTIVEELKKSDGKPVTVDDVILKSPAVTVRRTLFGDRGVTEEHLKKIVGLFGEVANGNISAYLLLTGPFARFLFTISPHFRKTFNSLKKLIKLVDECTQIVQRSMDEDFPTCIVEQYYNERNKRRRENDPTWKYFTDEGLRESLIQFVLDGISTVASFTTGFLCALAQHPDEQEKVFAEISEVVGANRLPTPDDKQNLPYTNAFINEYTRFSNVLPTFPGVQCTKETTIRGYRIPVGAVTLYNFTAMNTDPDTFEDPESFNPSRFIPSPGKPKAELPVIFGIGKRTCAGEAFVMLQTFLLMVTLVKDFKIVAPNARGFSTEDIFSGKVQLSFVPRTKN